MSRERNYPLVYGRAKARCGGHRGRAGCPVGGEAVPLAEALKAVFDGPFTNEQKRLEQLRGLWEELVPQELRGHCKVVGFMRGVVKVQVDLPAYAYQLRLYSSELLVKLQDRPGLSGVSELRIIL
jgi:hypothetical protein